MTALTVLRIGNAADWIVNGRFLIQISLVTHCCSAIRIHLVDISESIYIVQINGMTFLYKLMA